MIKIRNRAGEIVIYTGLTEEKTAELAATIKQCLASQPTVLMAIVGNKGVGKSLLGKYFRNRGIGPFHRRKIAVIDDDNMAVDTLYFFRRWCPIPCTGVDELAPFMKYCRKKQIRIYIKSDPESRISRADIVLQVSTPETTREQRLINRYDPEKGPRVFNDTRDYPSQINIAYDHLITAGI
ncbi:hypothetical protein JCM12296A_18260 [Desulfosarcina cetonica]|uniref:hypothetical protein n=1 Tax=Desulfosarcina cetonica TaxID=90730 RepID=UPI0006D09A68|nr:hypothetical protein [Desulfosarcina cetonica]